MDTLIINKTFSRETNGKQLALRNYRCVIMTITSGTIYLFISLRVLDAFRAPIYAFCFISLKTLLKLN